MMTTTTMMIVFAIFIHSILFSSFFLIFSPFFSTFHILSLFPPFLHVSLLIFPFSFSPLFLPPFFSFSFIFSTHFLSPFCFFLSLSPANLKKNRSFTQTTHFPLDSPLWAVKMATWSNKSEREIEKVVKTVHVITTGNSNLPLVSLVFVHPISSSPGLLERSQKWRRLQRHSGKCIRSYYYGSLPGQNINFSVSGCGFYWRETHSWPLKCNDAKVTLTIVVELHQEF